MSIVDRKYPIGTSPVERVRLLRQGRIAAGLCAYCGGPRERQSVQSCDTCLKRYHADAYKRGARVTLIARRTATRAAVLAMYGNACACCGETRNAFLTFHHVNGDGLEHRRDIKRNGSSFTAWLSKQRKRKDIRLLCRNCHWAHHYTGQCPHEAERAALVADW